MTRMTRPLIAALLLTACGDDDGGGGYARFSLIAEENGAPIAGGDVIVDGVSIGTTDASGIVEGEYNDGHLVEAVGSASGRAGGAYVGGARDTITITLARSTAPAMHTVSGSIDGWDGLAPPAAGHRMVALVDRSRPVSEVMISGVGAADPIAAADAAACVRDSMTPAPCNWSLAVPEGTWSIAAAIVIIDGMGTTASDDDTVVSVESFGIATAVEVAGDVSGVMLAPAAAVMLSAMVPDPGSGLEVIGVPGVGVGGTVLVFPVPAIPELTGPLAEARAWVIGEGRGADRSVMRVARGVTPGGEVVVGALPAPPDVAHDTGVVTVSGSGLRMVRVTHPSGEIAWTAWLDGPDATVDSASLDLALSAGGRITGLTFDPASITSLGDVEAVGRTSIGGPID